MGKKINSSLSYTPKYGGESKWNTIKRRVRLLIIEKIQGTPLQLKWYGSYWHYIFSSKKTNNHIKPENHFISEIPNYGAGIGHQMANWNTGFFFAGYFKKEFAHFPFSSSKWEKFLGFSEDEISALSLKENRKYKVVNIPIFNSANQKEIDFVGKIMDAYKRPNILFVFESDQGYTDQYHTANIISQKFFKASSRKDDKLIFNENSLNIAVHIRRRMKIETDDVWKMRGLDNDYFSKVLQTVLSVLKTIKTVQVYLFSQGSIEEYPEFKDFKNLYYCMDMGPVESFLHMVNADILISSKSSFSYKPALISKGIKICPSTFWHGYPTSEDFILVDNDSSFDTTRLLAFNK